ncbi:hypothetical protein PPERSA_12201 [Pseudocohnilembus persalinus]|uniref:Trichohyalin-plectin-homology domain-containing protein n=1 Tax=Pseudocohnilembus persalinus TaxID=266149 RepID=A0A0V0R8T5_PSEPJ|nr:hypothetical protein PPERSA_12201 [Pseudocohnilembus persalinus]|eukprot:KRX10850.1 hypothetical protein PPERSA_12201 [Pseudocohnilembus persalinus]
MSQVRSVNTRTAQNSKVKSTINRAEAIQQREQLRQMVLNKFITDLAKNNKKKQAVIEQEVQNFFASEKVTEATLKDLKARVYAAVNQKQEHTRLLEEMEQQRNLEKKNREEKIKKIMSAFADSVVKDQKQIIREEDQKMMRHILDQNARENADDEARREAQRQQKREMREFLQKQMQEKEQRKKADDEVNKMQAEIWSKDRQNYMEHERQKEEYIKMVNKKHQEILKDQMTEQNRKLKKGKMTVEELLQNKSKLKNIADQDPQIAEKLKKTVVTGPK